MKKISYIPKLTYDPKIEKYLSHTIGVELGNLVKSCYFPKLVKYYQDLREMINLSQEDVQEFRRRNISTKYQSFLVFNSQETLVPTIAMLYYIRNGHEHLAELFHTYLTIKFQSSLVHRFFPQFCNEEVFNMALERISYKHLYHSKGGISSAVSYIDETEWRRTKDFLKSQDLTDDLLVRVINALRNRLSQSIKSFAVIYYKIAEDYKKEKLQDGEELSKGKEEVIIEKISQQICVFSNIDNDVLLKASTKTGIRKDVGQSIVTGISKVEFKEKIRFLLVLFNRIGTLSSYCSESNRLTFLRKVEMKQTVDKYEVRAEVLKVIKSIPDAYRFNSIYDSQLVLFLCNYLTLYITKRIC